MVELRFARAAEQHDALARVRDARRRGSSRSPTACSSTPTTATRTAAAVAGDGVGAASVLVRRASLEDVFLILTGRTLED